MTTTRRFTKSHPCPICGGHDGLARNLGVRCFGYLDESGRYARCTREEKAGNLPQNRDGTYSHWLEGECRCGETHQRDAHPHRVSAQPGRKERRRRPEQRFRSFFTLRAYVLRRYGETARVRYWIYRDVDGIEAFRVLRVDYAAPDGGPVKSYRPCHKAADGKWLLSRPDRLLPLYNLPLITAASLEQEVVVLEGEKCAEIAASLGLPVVTTSAHGAKAPQLTDWSPLAGRFVVILGDADADGIGYAAQVSSILHALDPPADVHIVTLPGLSDGEDIEQFVRRHRRAGHTDAQTLNEVLALIAASR